MYKGSNLTNCNGMTEAMNHAHCMVHGVVDWTTPCTVYLEGCPIHPIRYGLSNHSYTSYGQAGEGSFLASLF